MSNGNLTRKDVEKRLQSRESSIADRLESLESEMPGKALARVKSMSSRKLKVGVAVGAGLVLGLLIAGKKRDGKSVRYDEGLEELSDKLSKRISKSISSGQNSDDAVREALERVPPVMNLSKEDRGVLREATSQFLRVVSKMVAKKGASHLIHFFGLDDKEAGQESTNPES